MKGYWSKYEWDRIRKVGDALYFPKKRHSGFYTCAMSAAKTRGWKVNVTKEGDGMKVVRVA